MEIVTLVEIVIAIVTAILIPWSIWVTNSIYNLRLQNALIKKEIGLLETIKGLLNSKESDFHFKEES